MAAENMIVVTFEEPSKAYQALSVLKHQGLERKINLHSAAVVERTAEGAYAIKESETPRAGSTTSTGGLIGAVVGILGGPIGVLLGWGAGALAGAALEANDAVSSLAALKSVGEKIQPGATGLVAELEEEQPHQTDWELGNLGGTVSRWTSAEIEEDIKAAHQAQAAAEKEARRVVGENRIERFGDRIQDAVGDLRDRLPGGDR